MQEQLNKAMASLSNTVGEDVPSLEEIREKIESRYAQAKGMSELQETSVESRMLEVESATASFEATMRLAEIRAQLGLEPVLAAEHTAAAVPPEAQPGQTAVGT